MRRDDRGLLWFALGFLGITALAVSMEVLADECTAGGSYSFYQYTFGSRCYDETTQFANAAAGKDSCPPDWTGMFPAGWNQNYEIVKSETATEKVWETRYCHPDWGTSVCQTGLWSVSVALNSSGVGPAPWCPEPLDCTPHIGERLPLTWSGGGAAPSCVMDIGGAGCSVTAEPISVTVGATSFNWGTITGESCTPGETAAGPDDPPVNCVEDGGQQHCISANDANCGYVNGERWCPPVASDYVVTAQGAIISNDTSSPVVDSLGDPVAPDSTMESGGDTYNYYSSETVNSNTVVGVGAGNPDQSGSGVPGAGPAGDGGPGDGDGDGDGEEEGEGSFADACTVAGGACPTIADTYAALGAALTGTSDGIETSVFPGGGLTDPTGAACPVIAFDAFGSTISATMHCDIIDEHRPYIALVFMLVYGLAATRIVLSA